MAESPESMQCPRPLDDYPRIVMGHGGGGRLTQELLERVFLPALDNPALRQREDAASLGPIQGRLAFSTDSYVVQPLFFPGGCIGDLAVHGTVNDLAMRGAMPVAISAAFILEEGLPIETLQRIVAAMALASKRVGVPVVTGDTKVVERGHGDGCFITTSGIGILREGVELSASIARPGDAILINGTIGDHGMAILSHREGMEFGSPIVSDTAPLHELVATMLAVCPEIRSLRDPTRGGVTTTLHEIAAMARVGMELDESSLPVESAVQSACELFGLDPLSVANEGKLIAIVPANSVDRLLEAMRSHPQGRHAALIGRVTSDASHRVVMRTALGTARMIPMPIGEQLPRIC
ncbi:MAG: hydrogenase expression/formation protein HypE [Planctomycetota bacterium]|jgi:hydrogenase expression/formation protein HypE